MQQLICDGELGLMSPSAQSHLRSLGVEPKLRAPGQHARFIERRGALLRLSMQCIEAQLTREGVESSIDAVLSEAVFAGNALIHVGGVTPYQCVYGRLPAMLPPKNAENSGFDCDVDGSCSLSCVPSGIVERRSACWSGNTN